MVSSARGGCTSAPFGGDRRLAAEGAAGGGLRVARAGRRGRSHDGGGGGASSPTNELPASCAAQRRRARRESNAWPRRRGGAPSATKRAVSGRRRMLAPNPGGAPQHRSASERRQRKQRGLTAAQTLARTPLDHLRRRRPSRRRPRRWRKPRHLGESAALEKAAAERFRGAGDLARDGRSRGCRGWPSAEREAAAAEALAAAVAAATTSRGPGIRRLALAEDPRRRGACSRMKITISLAQDAAAAAATSGAAKTTRIGEKLGAQFREGQVSMRVRKLTPPPKDRRTRLRRSTGRWTRRRGKRPRR